MVIVYFGALVCPSFLQSFYLHEVRKTLREVLRAGIDQADVSSADLLWNEERRRVMLIDFERAIVVSAPKRPMTDADVPQELSPNKKYRHCVTGKGYL